MKSHGFVVRMLRDRRAGALEVERADGQSFAAADGCRFYARPFETAPEHERAAQPLVADDLILVYDGWVDNRAELARRLGRPELSDRPDGEALAAAYRAWGKDFPLRVIGEYSFALFDRRTRVLLAGRDALGIAECYFSLTPTELRVGSDLELLVRTMPHEPELDCEGMLDLIVESGYSSYAKTVFRNIERLDPATVFIVAGERTEEYRYWSPDPSKEVRFRDPEEYGEALREMLFEAVRVRLRAGGPVLADLSGGLDSSTIAVIARKLDRAGAAEAPGVRAVCFSDATGEVTDDGRWQKVVLDEHPMTVHGVDVRAIVRMPQADDRPWCAPSPNVQAGGLVSSSKSLAVEDGARVRLVGDMGDEVFCGNRFPPIYLHDRIREHGLCDWATELQRLRRKGERSLWNLLTVCTRGSLACGIDQLRGDVAPPEWLAPSVREQFRALAESRRAGGPRIFERRPGREYHFRLIDRSARRIAGLAFGLYQSIRAPFSHRPLIEFLLALPWEHKVSATEDRIVMRRGLSGVLPEVVRKRRDKGGGRGPEKLMLELNGDHLRALARGRCLTELGLVDGGVYRAACERYLRGFARAGTRRFMNAAFILEAWLLRDGASAARRFPAGELHFCGAFNRAA